MLLHAIGCHANRENIVIEHCTTSQRLYSSFRVCLPPLIFSNLITKTRVAPPGICPPAPRSPYALSDGMYISHMSPSTICCIASVHPLITWFGANAVVEPRSNELSNCLPSIVTPL